MKIFVGSEFFGSRWQTGKRGAAFNGTRLSPRFVRIAVKSVRQVAPGIAVWQREFLPGGLPENWRSQGLVA